MSRRLIKCRNVQISETLCNDVFKILWSEHHSSSSLAIRDWDVFGSFPLMISFSRSRRCLSFRDKNHINWKEEQRKTWFSKSNQYQEQGTSAYSIIARFGCEIFPNDQARTQEEGGKSQGQVPGF